MAEAANPRIALVIGESAYSDGALPTTANDAGLVAQVLQAAGFDVVGARDLDGKGVREAFRDFLDKANSAGPDMQAFVYISGRALQYSGDNYLAPIDARIARAADAPIEGVKINDFTHALAAAPGLARVVVIDGARANPYAQQGDPLAGGLALVDPEPNTVVAFNAAPGALGVQDAGDYGVYAKSLTGQMRQGGVDIRQVFEQVRLDVNQQTQGAQIPWSAGKLSAPYFIFERAADAPPPKRPPARKPNRDMPISEAYPLVVERDDFADYEWFVRTYPDAPEARRIRAILAARREATFWRRALDRDNPRAYWTYLRRYPHGPHAWDAYRRLDMLAAAHEPPHDFHVMEFEGLPPPPEAEIVYADRPYYYFGGDDYGPPPPAYARDYIVEDDDDWRNLPPPPRPSVVGVLPALAVAIPLGLAARAYLGRPAAGGVAPASAPPPSPPRPMGPPPLPGGVKPVAVPTVAASPAAPLKGGAGAVRFAPPTAVTAAPTPVATPTPAAGALRTPLPTPSVTPGATPPAGALRTPLPTPSVTPGATPPAGALRTPLPTPSVTPGATPAAGGVRTPLPTPSAKPTGAEAPALRTTLPTPAAKTPAPLETSAPKLNLPKPAPGANTGSGATTPSTPPPPKLAPPPPPARKPSAPPPPAPKPAPPPPPAPKPAPPPPPAPKPAPPPPPAPKPAPPPPAPKPAPPAPKPAAKPACGHPGEPRC